jgi:hypothetical protein
MRFVCFSSGATQRYRDDIIRAMAMPDGCELTFRYRLKYVALSVQEHLKSGSIGQADQVLICYLDQSERSKPVDFIPVRFATLIEAPLIGDFVVLRMRVQKFAFAADLDVFNRDLLSRSAEVPKWPSNPAEPYATGAFWVEVNDYPKSVVESTSIADWQVTVSHLLKRKDFGTSGPFYQVVRLQDLKHKTVVQMKDGQYSLQPGNEYEVLIDHFLPIETTASFQLETSISGSGLEFITGSTMQIDSPYDRHWLRFKTQEPLKDERTVLTLSKKASGADPAVQFDLPILISGRLGKSVWIGIAVGLLLAVPQITTAWINPAFGNRSLGWLIGLSLFIAVFNFAVGITAALNFRRPI